MKHPIRRAPFLAILVSFFVPLGSASAADRFDLGAIFSLSSWGAFGGTAELNGALLAEADINSKGGIAGKPLKLIVEDNASDLKATAAAFNKLVNVDKVIGIVGPNWAEFTEVAVPLAEKNRVPLVSPSGNKEGLFKGTRYSATLLLPHRRTVRPLARHIAEKKFSRVAVVLAENAYLNELYKGMTEELAESDIKLEPVVRLNQGETDYRSTITKLRSAKPDALLLLLAEGGELGSFFRQAKQLDFSVPTFSSNTVSFDHELRKDPSIADGVVYFDFKMAGGADFIARYKERFKADPTYASARGYDAVLAFKHAIESCGPARAMLASCIRKNSFHGETGTVKFSSDGVLVSDEEPTELLQVRGGKFEKL